MNPKKILLVLGIVLLGLGFYGKIPGSFNPTPNSPNTDVLELSEPEDANLKKEALDVSEIFKRAGNSSKNDSSRLRDLYLDLAKLISLDGEDMVIKNTEEIRQANSVAGAMFRLDIKDKYPNLAKEAGQVVVAAIGDDQVNLSPELRSKAVDAFNALAWGCNEGSK